MHEDLIFNTPGGVGGEFDVLFQAVGADGLDEADGADGDQILLIGFGGVVFFHDMGNQAEVAFDEGVSGVQVAGGGALQAIPFLFGAQGTGEAAGGEL